MIKHTVDYIGFDEKPKHEVLYFNLSKTEILDNMDLREQLVEIEEMLQGPERQLEDKELYKVLNLVKRMAKLSYGRRSEDGTRFRKTDEIWDDFYSSPAYDTFMMSLFENPEEAFKFIVAVMPGDLVEQAQRELAESQEGETVVELPHNPVENAQDKLLVIEPGTWANYTQQQLLAMTDQQFEAATAGLTPLEMPRELLVVAMQRKNR